MGCLIPPTQTRSVEVPSALSREPFPLHTAASWLPYSLAPPLAFCNRFLMAVPPHWLTLKSILCTESSHHHLHFMSLPYWDPPHSKDSHSVKHVAQTLCYICSFHLIPHQPLCSLSARLQLLGLSSAPGSTGAHTVQAHQEMACLCWLLIIQDSVEKPLPGKAFTGNSVSNNPCHLISYPNYYSLNHKLPFQSIYLLCPSFPSFNDSSVTLAILFFLCLNQRLVHKSE